uniref:NADH dehydrogenase subunit 1 n=1 Tax=Cryptocephalus dimidiatipennis TaxID=2978450 RepID=UPI0021CCF527|nr:NADH dehydrogenase subunit 1 [Cryptocephalus dimidiatipennis]UWV18209.1 NADH dehydrogenase subunit 1 [Cryptocephalus dimidiatipennis]
MFKDLTLFLLTNLIMLVGILISVAFLTLFERKILGYIQIRKGPNKLGFLGLLQPFSDAIKLFSKEQTFPYLSNFNIYYLSPIVGLFLSLLLWCIMPFFSYLMSFNLSVMFMLGVSSLGVYCVMLAGWSSNSNYSLLGSLRAVAQTISYEVSLFLMFLSFLFLVLDYSFISFLKYQEFIWFLFIMFPLCVMWVTTCLAETNRTPFDFAEGESELVSGFNVEYSGGGFAMIFLAEYSSIIFMSMVCSLLFLGANFNSFTFFVKIGFMSFLWVWVRGTLPRYRYDKLMYLAWKSYLPVSLCILLMYMGLKLFILTLYI